MNEKNIFNSEDREAIKEERYTINLQEDRKEEKVSIKTKLISLFSKDKTKGYKESEEANEPKETKEANESNKSLTNRFHSIKYQLAIGLLIPVVLLAVYGVVSYYKSVAAIVSNYEESTIDTVDAMSKYMNMGLSMMERSALEITSDVNIRDYFDLDYDEAKDLKDT